MNDYSIKIKKELRTEIRINASADRVWDILLDFDNYPEWNPFIKSIQGIGHVGKSLQVHIVPANSKGMKLKPNVIENKALKSFRWLGHLGIRGLFDGEHVFELIPENNSVLFVHREGFSGLLIPLFKTMLDVATRQGFIAMNEALKKRAENVL